MKAGEYLVKVMPKALISLKGALLKWRYFKNR